MQIFRKLKKKLMDNVGIKNNQKIAHLMPHITTA